MSTPHQPTRALWLLALLTAGAAGRSDAAPLPVPRLTPVEAILGEIITPPLSIVAFGPAKPPPLRFTADVLARYRTAPDPRSKLRRAVLEAHLALWAAAPVPTPPALRWQVRKVRAGWRMDVKALPTTYRVPARGAETHFNGLLLQQNKALARIVSKLEEALEELEAAGGERKGQPQRWRASYDLLLGRLLAQLALLSEQQSALGMLRRDPRLNPAQHTGWQLRATARLHDAESRKLARRAARFFGRVIHEHPGTPWEALARQHRSTPLGLEWEPVR
jgi:hypothetical protein